MPSFKGDVHKVVTALMVKDKNEVFNRIGSTFNFYITSNNISVKTLSFPVPANGEWVVSDVVRTYL